MYEILVERCGLAPGTRCSRSARAPGRRRGACSSSVPTRSSRSSRTRDLARLPRALGSAIASSCADDARGCRARAGRLRPRRGGFVVPLGRRGRRAREGPRRAAAGRLGRALVDGFGDETPTGPVQATRRPTARRLPRQPGRQPPRGGRALDARTRSSSVARARRSRLRGASRTSGPRGRTSWDAEGIRGLFATFSPILVARRRSADELLDEVERIARTEFGGRVEKPLVTSLYTARKPS